MLFIAPIERVKEGLGLEILNFYKVNGLGYYRYSYIKYNKNLLMYEMRTPQENYEFCLDSDKSLEKSLLDWGKSNFNDTNLKVDYYDSLKDLFNVLMYVTDDMYRPQADYIYFVSSLEEIQKEFEKYEYSHTIVYKVLGGNMDFLDILEYLN